MTFFFKQKKKMIGTVDAEVLEEDLKGVIFKRIPLPSPDFKAYRNIPFNFLLSLIFFFFFF